MRCGILRMRDDSKRNSKGMLKGCIAVYVPGRPLVFENSVLHLGSLINPSYFSTYEFFCHQYGRFMHSEFSTIVFSPARQSAFGL